MDNIALETQTWINYEILNNPLRSYLIAFGILVAVWLLLSLLRMIVAKQLKRLGKLTSRDLLFFLAEVTKNIHPYVLFIIAFHVAVHNLTFAPLAFKVVTYITTIAVIWQLTSIASQSMSYLTMQLRFGRTQNDLALQSARSNLNIIGKAVVWVAGSLFLLSNLGINVTTFITGLGIGGIAIALAAQTILSDTFSSFAIALDKPFEVGDAITVDGLGGTVEHIGLKTTRLRSFSGELLVFANSKLTATTIQNFQKMSTRRVRCFLGVTYDTQAATLKQIPDLITEAVTSTADTNFERAHFEKFGDSSLVFEVVYWVNSPAYLRFTQVQQEVNFKILDAFAQHGIGMAFPTQTLHVASLPTPNKR